MKSLIVVRKTSSPLRDARRSVNATLLRDNGRSLAPAAFLPPFVQAKLRIGSPNDKYEQEAERVANQVIRMPRSSVPRQAPQSENNAREMLTAEPITAQLAAGSVSEFAPAVANVLGSPGRSLDAESRAFFEPRIGYDFSHVRIHTNSDAAAAALSMNAHAFTLGRDIVFGAGQLGSTQEDRRLLAHELTHVVQQSRGIARARPSSESLFVSSPNARTAMAPLIQRSPTALAAVEVVAGLAETASLAGEIYQQSRGGLTYSSTTAHRISDNPQPRKNEWRTVCLTFDSGSEFQASAVFNLVWEGNDYGEIGSARVRIDIEKSDDFDYSSANVTFNALPNLIQPGGDKRTWQMRWDYEGSYDPFGYGDVLFQGTFTIDAFGNFKSEKHISRDRAPDVPLAKWDRVVPGPDVEHAIPPLPGEEQPPPPPTAPH